MKTTLLLLSVLYANSLDFDCSAIRTGNFSTDNDDGTHTVVIRSENLQTEYHNEGTQVTTFTVIWRNECEYLLCDRKVIVGEDLYPDFNDTLKILITRIEDSYYEGEGELLVRGWKQNVKVNIDDD